MFPLLKVTFLILNLWITQSHQEPTGTAPEQTPPVVEVSPVADPLSLLGKPAPALVLNDIDGIARKRSDWSRRASNQAHMTNPKVM